MEAGRSGLSGQHVGPSAHTGAAVSARLPPHVTEDSTAAAAWWRARTVPRDCVPAVSHTDFPLSHIRKESQSRELHKSFTRRAFLTKQEVREGAWQSCVGFQSADLRTSTLSCSVEQRFPATASHIGTMPWVVCYPLAAVFFLSPQQWGH